MPGSNINSDQQVQNGAPPLPLQSFFTDLKLNGFLVTPEQIADANRIITHYASQVQNEAELCNYLSPLFVRNQEEQFQFEDIFKAYFIAGKELPGASKEWSLQQHLKNSWWKYVSGAILVAVSLLLFYYYHPSKPVLDYHPDISLYDKNAISKREEGKRDFQISTHEKLEVYPLTQYGPNDTTHQITLAATYNWGDLSTTDTTSTHLYNSDGKFKLTAYVSVFYKGVFQYIDTIHSDVLVCEAGTGLVLSNLNNSDSVKVGEKITLSATVTGEKPDSIRWQNDESTLGYGNTFSTIFEKKGQQTIYCLGIYDSVGSPCTVQQNITITVYDPDKPVFNVSFNKTGTARPVLLPVKAKPFWLYLTGALSLLSLAFVVLFAIRTTRKKNEIKEHDESFEEQFNKLLFSFSGKKYPAALPFQNKNYLPVPEAEINEAAKQMRRRINNDSFFLQIQKTIERAISNMGFFQPVYAPRLQQSEYLVLIDASHNNNQQVKLFDYLVEILKKQNVFIEKYYYKYEPNLCYNNFEPGGISLEKLSEKYDKNILLIFGSAYQLLYQFYPVFNTEYLQLLNRWQYKAVITPVSFSDWGNKETQALLPQIPVVPVDVQGQLSLMETLFTENYDITTAIKQHQQSFYKAAAVDFENVTELKNYCKKAPWANVTEDGKAINILFQWIAALSVYPKIKWEITLAIGKAILDKYKKTAELNFTNLLRIARIKWMKDGQFPDYTRLDLLKELTESNEIIARETILSLLQEIPESEVSEKHFAYEEKEVQRISNQFILYAYNPVKYAGYKESGKLYQKLYQENKITDAPSRIYLKNEQSEWGTLINKTVATKEPANVPLEEYFKPEKANSVKDRVSILLFRICSVVFLLSIAGFIILITAGMLNTNKLSAFTYKPPVTKNIRFNLFNNTRFDINRMTLSIDSIVTNGGGTIALMLDSSIKFISLKLDGSSVYDTALLINYDAYDIRINQDTLARKLQNSMVANVLLSNNCKADPAIFSKIIHQVDSAIVVKDSIISTDNLANSNCTYQVSYGANISAVTINALIKNFTDNYIQLKVHNSDSVQVPPNQINIYPAGAFDKLPLLVFIQYNDRQQAGSVTRLMGCLNNNAYRVPGIEYQPAGTNFYRNEIRYFYKSCADSIARLQSCLRSVYPGRNFTPVFVPKTRHTANFEIWVYDSVNLVDYINTKQTKQQNAAVPPYINNRTINSGDLVATASGAYGRMGLFLKNSAGEVFGVCSAPIFPSDYVASKTIFASRDGKNEDSIGAIYRQSSATVLLGLVKLLNTKGANYLSGLKIKGFRNVTAKQKVYLYDPVQTNKGEVKFEGVVKQLNYTGQIVMDRTDVTIKNAFSCDIKMGQGLSGSVLVDKDNYALGILVGGNDTMGIFVPVAQILKEFNMELLLE